MIGEIRTMLPRLYEQGRTELGREIMGGVDVYNFVGVTDAEVRRVHAELADALRCRYCRGDERATSCDCV